MRRARHGGRKDASLSKQAAEKVGFGTEPARAVLTLHVCCTKPDLTPHRETPHVGAGGTTLARHAARAESQTRGCRQIAGGELRLWKLA